MTKKETTSEGALWRKRALATLGVAAVVASGGVALASSASAAAPAPVITITAPAAIPNDATGFGTGASGQFVIEINNSAAGNAAVAASPLVVTLTVPAGLACTNVALVQQSKNPATAAYPFASSLGAGTSPNCTFTAPNYTQPANSDYTFTYELGAISTGIADPTGTITSQAVLTQTIPVGNGNNTTVVSTSNTGTTKLTASAAATLAAAPPAAIIYQDYSAKVVSSTGVPSARPDQYSVFESPTEKQSDGTYGNGTLLTTNSSVRNPATQNFDAAIKLEDGLFLDTVTGDIVGTPTETDSAPAVSYTIIVNNGVGGATTPVPAGNGGTTAKPTPAVAVHDVDSAPFTIPVLFNDVAVDSTFGAEIYLLADQDAIKGFADGSYRPGGRVTRQEFVNILVGYDPNNVIDPITGNGSCSTISPSAFSDVPNSSIFCQAIKELSQLGIVNGSGGKFRPSATVSREEIAAFIYRFYAVQITGNSQNGDAPAPATAPFKDVSTSNIFAGDIAFAAKKGIVNGYTDGTFRPNNATTRDAAAAIIGRTQF